MGNLLLKKRHHLLVAVVEMMLQKLQGVMKRIIQEQALLVLLFKIEEKFSCVLFLNGLVFNANRIIISNRQQLLLLLLIANQLSSQVSFICLHHYDSFTKCKNYFFY